MNGFASLEDVGEQFKKSADIETEALFVQGRIIRRAVEQGFDMDEVTGYCASMVMKTKRTIYRYYSVARTFPSQMFDLPFEMHAIAADTIDYRKNMAQSELAAAQKNARQWLKIAKENAYSTRALRAAIAEAGGRVDVKPEVLLDGVECVIANIQQHVYGSYSLHLLIKGDAIPVDEGTQIKITLVKAVAQPEAES